MLNALNTTTVTGFAPLHDLTAVRPATGRAPAPQATTPDMVSIRAPHLLSDAEAAQAMDTVQETVEHNPGEALSVHSGLEYDRVMALLGMG